jgi:predicted P-loop ATPase
MLMVSMIARAYDPGCLYRYVVVFQGPEEYRKSTFVSQMVPYPEWQDTVTESFESKDMPALINALWIAELAELDSLTRTEETRLKSFVTKRTDSYVPKWGLFRVSPPRRTIFIGTTNEKTWLKSSTGNTRWLPIAIQHPMEVEELILQREQLYAEAKVWYGDHLDTWWQMPPEVEPEAKDQREARRQETIYESTLDAWLHDGRFHDEKLRFQGLTLTEKYTTWEEIAIGYLGMETRERWKDMGLQKQIAQALKALHWYPTVDKDAQGRSVRCWKREAPLPF